MTKRPFGSKGNRVEGLLELVHSDVCGPMSVKARGGYDYYVTFIDDYSRYGYVYLMHRKSETFDKFKEFRAEVEKQFVPKTPHELWTGKRTTLNHIRIWGCPAHVLDKESGKLDSRSEVCMFVGYPRETKGGYFYNLKENKVFVSMNVIFLEESYIQDFKARSKVILEDMSNRIVSSEVPNVDSYPINEERQTEQQIPKGLRRSWRIIRQPDRFMSSGEALEAELIGHENDPYTYNEAMGDVDANLWKKAMNVEMESMGSNKV
ncbi:hypothetical protein UlMin_027555 [Ulmus minor]